MTAADAFRHIAQSCVRQFRLNEALLLAGRDAGALHQVRVALRRLRSAFSIFKPVIGGDAHTPLRDELRWLASELANARNLDVLLERAKPGALRDRIAASREAAYDAVGERSEEHTSELQSLMRISYAVFCLKKKKNKT